MTASTATIPASTKLVTRVNPFAGLTQSLTVAWRTLVRIKHNPADLADLSVQPIVFTLLFAFVFGGAIGGSVETYVQFLIPGVLVGNMLFTTLTVGQGLNSDLTKGVFDRLQSLPIARWAPLAGRVIADQFKQLWTILVSFLIGLLLGFRFEMGVIRTLAALGLILLFAVAFSWVAVLIGVMSKDPEQVNLFGLSVLLPICFASGQFSPPDTMPGWLQWFAEVNPVGILLQATRGLINGGPVSGPVTWTLVWIAVLVIVFAPLSVRALKRRVS
ncbi:ABC transporter permease [Salinispora arenicola]|uniref:Transport permease protein n=1 Tax=Salinispora arenicola TaxID=168697 RepID=A0A542XTS5_SALAC|nr:ABC transporter permease [Salinispora arenicola]MCN0151988.1 ABC transporter permease [Salinispora arenicola]NIL40144.1 ABC transporter permease [Salinispora arenicola]TQL39083.1 ABC-2 type transport system permease protein/oleandomycin transport system permease protein [Salinispora arenicola]GIM86902.1 transport permease protein [Salinispora arenicola]